MFKGRRRRAGWVPARDHDDDGDGDGYGYGEDGGGGGADAWDSADEPLREMDRGRDGGGGDEYPRVGSTPASRFTVLTDATTAGTHKSREATHVDAAGAESSARLLGSSSSTATAASASPAPVVQAPPALASSLVPREVPDEAWHDAGDTGSGVVGDSADSSHAASRLGYHAPQPRRADSEQEIPLFAGSTPFR